MYETLDDVPEFLQMIVTQSEGEYGYSAGEAGYNEAEFNRALDLMRGFPDEWPEGARIAVQNNTGSWAFSDSEEATPSDIGGWDIKKGGGYSWFGFSRGTIIGDWRTTLRKRPVSSVKSNDSVGDSSEKLPNSNTFEVGCCLNNQDKPRLEDLFKEVVDTEGNTYEVGKIYQDKGKLYELEGITGDGYFVCTAVSDRECLPLYFSRLSEVDSDLDVFGEIKPPKIEGWYMLSNRGIDSVYYVEEGGVYFNRDTRSRNKAGDVEDFDIVSKLNVEEVK